MRIHLTLAATAILLLSAVSVAGPAVATDDDQSYSHANDAEHYPDCRGEDEDGDGDGDRQASAVTIDPNNIDSITGQDFFTDDDKISQEVDLGVEGEQFLTFCSGENWDGQDPNTRESDRNNEAGGSSDEPIVDAQEGDVYVNPLYDGDCSGWNSDHHADGCSGGTDKPQFTEVVNLRATVDAPGASDTDPEATVYTNLEIWGVGRSSTSVRADHAQDGDNSDRGGWAALYLEDHSDQASEEVFGPDNEDQPLCPEISSDCFDGNYLLIPFDPLQGGSGGEGDCNSHEYQSANTGGQHGDHFHSCERDNTALVTLQFGYSWLPEANTETPPTLP